MEKTKVVFGDRISKQGEVRLGCSAIIFDSAHRNILLTQRTDNGQWCLPGGRVEAGDSVAEACAREVYEETGLLIQVTRLYGIYSDPNKLVIYPDGNKVHIIALSFEAEIIGGELGGSDETTAWGFFNQKQIDGLDMLAGHQERIHDSFLGLGPVIK